jgi:hypothetical protein
MTPDSQWHLAEIIILGLPLWVGVFSIFFYPPHRHGYDRHGNPTIEYPRILAPGPVQRINGGDRE